MEAQPSPPGEKIEIYRIKLDDGISDVRTMLYVYTACNNETIVKIEQTGGFQPKKYPRNLRTEISAVQWKCFEQSIGDLWAIMTQLICEFDFRIQPYHVTGRIFADALINNEGEPHYFV